MHVSNREFPDDFRPRIIVWQLTRRNGFFPLSADLLTLHECLLILDSIARLAKPIVVLTGPKLIDRCDLHELVDYGNALGLKMIAELQPEEITGSLLDQFHAFGARTIRLIIDDRIVEEMNTRFAQSQSLDSLERAIGLLRSKGYEIHFSLTITQPHLRKLSFNLDYAFRSNAKGLYCHLRFDKTVPEVMIFADEVESLDEFIGKISDMKTLVPSDMYVSPQCVKFAPFPLNEQMDFDFSDMKHPRWIHQCLAGKTFAFIDEIGKVYMCSGMCKECGDLREEHFDFKKIWTGSELLQQLRDHQRSCVQTRLMIKNQNKSVNYQYEITDQDI